MPFEPPLLALALGLVIALSLHRSSSDWYYLQPLLIALVLVAAGMVCSKLRTLWVAAPILAKTQYSAQVHGIVEYVQPRNSRGPRVTILVRSLKDLAREHTPRRVRVRFQKPLPTLTPGQLISFKATLTPPAAPALPGGYDFGRAAYYQSLGAVGFAIGQPKVQPHADELNLLVRVSSTIQGWRQIIGKKVNAVLEGQTGAIANALMIGERGQVERSTLEAYRDAGLLHLLSISGLHMAIMAGSFFFSVRLLLACIEPIALRCAIKKWAALSAIIAAFGYLMISGSTHATIRAFVMITIIMAAIMLDRPGLALRNLAIAAMAILIVSPESLLHVGFQMSFAAVVALIATYEFFQARQSQDERSFATGWSRPVLWFLIGIIGSTIIASIAVAPIAAFHFHKSQQFAVLANLIAVPVCNLLVMPSALLAFLLMPLGLEAIPLVVMGQGIELMTWCAQRVAALPGAVSRVPAFSTLSFGLIIFGGLWLCLWQLSWRWFGIALIACGIGYAPYHARPDLLVGRDGRLVALRQSDGRLSVIRSRRTKFELERWLAHDGDSRKLSDVRNRDGFRCDRVGCTSKLADGLVAISRQPASLMDDCNRAAVLVLPYPEPAGCASDKAIIWDFWDLRRKGTHALFLDATGKQRIQTVADDRGNRPWSRGQFRTRPARRWLKRRTKTSASRLQLFASPQRLKADSNTSERPDIEGDDFAFDRL